MLAAAILGVALGVPPAPPLLGFTLALATALVTSRACRAMGVELNIVWIMEYAGTLVLAWVLTASLLHF